MNNTILVMGIAVVFILGLALGIGFKTDFEEIIGPYNMVYGPANDTYVKIINSPNNISSQPVPGKEVNAPEYNETYGIDDVAIRQNTTQILNSEPVTDFCRRNGMRGNDTSQACQTLMDIEGPPYVYEVSCPLFLNGSSWAFNGECVRIG